MLTNYLADIEQHLDAQRWAAALRDTFDLPQIAVALGDPQMRSSSARCQAWCRQWIRADGSNEDVTLSSDRICAALDSQGNNTADERFASQALRRLRLRRHARTRPLGFNTARFGNGAPGAADAIEICTATLEGVRRWYAQSACHDPVAQANLARLAVLR